jgi:hypothetical protein
MFSGGINIYSGGPTAWGDATHLYSNDSGLSPSTLHRYNVGPTTFTQIDAPSLDGMWGNIIYDNGLIYADGGGVTDASSAQIIGRYAATNTTYGNSYITIDSGINRVYFLSSNSYGVNSRLISIYDAQHFLPVNSLKLDGILGDAFQLLRWGSDGMAFRTAKDFWGSGSGSVILFRGSGVLPAPGAHQLPTANLLSPNNLSAGTGNTWLTVTGANFSPGAVVQWNGVERYTKVLDSTHLRVAIPASDLVSAGTATVTVVNVGTSASNGLTFTVN